MRIDTIGLRTWWLAGLAGWAALLCVLTAAGLGQRLPAPEPLPPPAALPALSAAAGERLGGFERYPDIAARPLFAPDRQPHPFYLASNDQGGSSELRLTGVLLTPQLQMATLTDAQGQSLRLRLNGEAVKGWRLLALAPRAATVEGAGGTRALELAVFNGQGGQPPSASPRPPATVNAGGNGNAAPSPAASPSPTPVKVGIADAAGNAGGDANAPPTPAPAPSAAQLQAIRDRIEARRRQLRERQ